MWRRRREDQRQVRPQGQGIGDGDTIMLFGQQRRWTELLAADTVELPTVSYLPTNPPPTATTDLVRPFVHRTEGPT